jgi:hypothetical protein
MPGLNQLRPVRLVTALATAAVAAGCGGDSGTAVEAGTVVSIEITQPSIALGLGATLQLTTNVRGKDGGLLAVSGMEWRSSNTAFVTVDAQGEITGVALGGPATITASVEGKSGTATVRVVPAQIAISPAITSLAVGESVELSATAYDAAGTVISVGAPTWRATSLAASTVVTISPSGLLTAVAPGAFELAVTLGGAERIDRLGVRSIYDGLWLGTNNTTAHLPLQVEVRFGSVTAFRIPNIVIQACTTRQLDVAVSGPIVNDQFSFNFSVPSNPGTTVTGTFTSPTTMTGAYGSISLGVFACDAENGGVISGHIMGSAAFSTGKAN